MYKITLLNKKVFSSEDSTWKDLDNSPIEKLEYFLNEKEIIVFSGFDKYIVLKEIEAVVGHSKPNVVSMSVLGVYKNKCYQFTQNLIWNKINQSINRMGEEYTPMSFNWKKQQWRVASGRPLNPSDWHDGVTTKPSVRFVK
ncbi:MAG: hypothetical protein M0R03_16950 [Novosphingobium sp.]|nr:hypothetical protein [Novosphingobium sp.]